MQPDSQYNPNPALPPQPTPVPPTPEQPQTPNAFPTPQSQFGAPQPQPQSQPMQQPYPVAPNPYQPVAPAQPQPTPDFQSHTSSHPQDHHINKKVVLIVVAVVVLGLVLLAYLIYAALNKSGTNPVSSVVNSVTGGNSDVQDRSDGKLDLGTLVDEAQTIKNQDLKAKLNQQINRSDGISYMVTKVERNWTSTSSYFKAHTGKEYIKVSLVVGNRTKSSSQYISDNMFKLTNSAGGLQSSEYATKDDVSDILEGQDLAPGKQVSGSAIFEVDSGEVVTLSTKDSYTKIGGADGGKEVTVTSEVTLQ